MRKDLANQLRERTDTIEFRAIKKQLMNAAQNGRTEYRVLSISDKTILQLQNQGITVAKFKEYDYEKFLLSWPVREDVPVAGGS